jgi:fibronectin-binding autotransporter adhesin
MSMIFKFLLFVFILVRVSILDVYSQIPTNTLPSLKTIDAGSVNVSTSNNSLNINQSSQQAIISWNSFNVGSSAKVNFNQPSASATTLNKIFDARPSQIFGQINANGKIILQNSAGIYFGPSSTLNVGSIVATTGTISNQDFLNNKFNFSRNNSTGNIVNEGILKAIDDFVALLAPNIRNEGLISLKRDQLFYQLEMRLP